MARDRVALVNLGAILSQAPHHLYRYLHAKPMVVSPVLDAACGVGYGSYIFAEQGINVTAVDLSAEAIDFGRRYYPSGNIEWICDNLLNEPWGQEKFNTVVSFETLEHLEHPDLALESFHDALNPGGKLICSVPNEEKYPFDPKAFEGEEFPHRRHYTPKEFETLLYDGGFEIIHRGTQLSKKSPTVQNGSGGIFLVYTTVKRNR